MVVRLSDLQQGAGAKLSEIQGQRQPATAKLSELQTGAESVWEANERGFVNNLRIPFHNWAQFIGDAWKGAWDEGMYADTLAWLGAEHREEMRENEKHRLTRPEFEFLQEMEAQGKTNTPEYQQALLAYDRRLEEWDKQEVSEFSFNLLKEAWKADAGAVMAEFTNALMADPQLAAIPVGAGAASKAASKVVKEGRLAQALAQIVARSTAAAGTAAAVVAPASIMDDLAKTGEIDWQGVGTETAIGAALAGVTVGAGTAAFQGGKGLRNPPRMAPDAGAATVSPTPGMTLAEAVTLRLPGRDLVEAVGDVWTNKAVSRLDPPAAVSPAMKTIRDLFEYTERSDTPIPPSFFERTAEATGRFLVPIQDALDTLRQPFTSRIPLSEERAIVAMLRDGRGTTPVVQGIRRVLDDVHNYLDDAGVQTGYLKNYFPRVYIPSRVERGFDEFVTVLSRHGVDAADAATIAQRIINQEGILTSTNQTYERMVQNGQWVGERMTSPNVRRNRHLDLQRRLTQIPDEELAPFMDNALYSVLSKYVQAAVTRAEYARAFGADEGVLDNLLRTALREGEAAGRPITRAEVARVYDLADALQRQYKPIQTRLFKQANTGVGAYQLMRTLTLATLSSMTEPYIILTRGTGKATLQSVGAVMDHVIRGSIRTLFKRFPKAEATRALEHMGVGLDVAAAERLTASFGGEVTRATNAFFKVTLLHQWTRLTRVVAFHTARNMITDHLDQLARGVTGRKAARLRRELTELGINPNTTPTQQQIDFGALRFTNEVVMNPRPTNRPMWHSNPHFHLIAQLKGFQTTFGNTVMKRWFQDIFQSGWYDGTRNAAKIAAVSVMMLATAMWMNEIREKVKYGPDGNPKRRRETAASKVIRAADRAGFTGAGQFAVDALYAHRFGASGISQILGPTASQVDQFVMKGVGAALEGDTAKLEREFVNAIPFLNTYKPARDEAVEMLREATR